MGLWFETFPPFLTRVSAVDFDNPTQIYSVMITGRPSLAIYCLRVYSPGGKARGLSLGYTDVIQQLEMKWHAYLKGDFALISPTWQVPHLHVCRGSRAEHEYRILELQGVSLHTIWLADNMFILWNDQEKYLHVHNMFNTPPLPLQILGWDNG